jgi:hypothetical protein
LDAPLRFVQRDFKPSREILLSGAALSTAALDAVTYQPVQQQSSLDASLQDYAVWPFALLTTVLLASLLPAALLALGRRRGARALERVRCIDACSKSRPLRDGDAVRKYSTPLGAGVTISFLFGGVAAAAVVGLEWLADNQVFASSVRPLPPSFQWSAVPAPLELALAFGADADASCGNITLSQQPSADGQETAALPFAVADVLPVAVTGAPQAGAVATVCMARLVIAAVPNAAALQPHLARFTLALPPSAQSLAWTATGIMTPAADRVEASLSASSAGSIIAPAGAVRGIAAASLALTVMPMHEQDATRGRSSHGLMITTAAAATTAYATAAFVPGVDTLPLTVTVTPSRQYLSVSVTPRTSILQLVASIVGLLSGLAFAYKLLYMALYTLQRRCHGKSHYELGKLLQARQRSLPSPRDGRDGRWPPTRPSGMTTPSARSASTTGEEEAGAAAASGGAGAGVRSSPVIRPAAAPAAALAAAGAASASGAEEVAAGGRYKPGPVPHARLSLYRSVSGTLRVMSGRLRSASGKRGPGGAVSRAGGFADASAGASSRYAAGLTRVGAGGAPQQTGGTTAAGAAAPGSDSESDEGGRARGAAPALSAAAGAKAPSPVLTGARAAPVAGRGISGATTTSPLGRPSPAPAAAAPGLDALSGFTLPRRAAAGAAGAIRSASKGAGKGTGGGGGVRSAGGLAIPSSKLSGGGGFDLVGSSVRSGAGTPSSVTFDRWRGDSCMTLPTSPLAAAGVSDRRGAAGGSALAPSQRVARTDARSSAAESADGAGEGGEALTMMANPLATSNRSVLTLASASPLDGRADGASAALTGTPTATATVSAATSTAAAGDAAAPAAPAAAALAMPPRVGVRTFPSTPQLGEGEEGAAGAGP